MVTCPECGGSQNLLLANGYYECVSPRLRDTVPAGVAGPTAIPVHTICGHRFQSPTGSEVPVCHVEGCGYYSIGMCVDCSRPTCGKHLSTYHGRDICPADYQAILKQETQAKESDAAQQRDAIAELVATLGSSSVLAEVTDSVHALKRYGATKYPPGVVPPSEEQLRHVWSVIRLGLNHPPLLDLVEIVGRGWHQKRPEITGERVPLWGYTLWFWYKQEGSPPSVASASIALSEAGDVFGTPNLRGSTLSNFRCERAPWPSGIGYILTHGETLRVRAGAADNAQLVVRAPSPRPIMLRDLVEYLNHSAQPITEFWSELDDRYASEGVVKGEVLAGPCEIVMQQGTSTLGRWY